MTTPAELLAPLQGNDDPDARVLLQMAQAGADLRKPHVPEFVFEVEKESAAHALATELANLDYSVQTYAPEQSNPAYQVIAIRTMVLELHALIQLSERFESLAQRHRAVYDGWGAEIVE